MIKRIRISNYALIEETEIRLEKGFTVITGETGAGKSILLGAIGLVLGQRTDTSAIRDKEKKCIVEAVFDLGGYGLEPWFAGNDLDYDRETVVRRELTPAGKSRSFINDTPVSGRLLKEFGSYLVDIHSQHQSLLLGRPGYQTDILDAFCGNAALLEEYGHLFRRYRETAARLEGLRAELAEAVKESDYLNFQFSRLEEARLQKGEKEELEKEVALLENAGSIRSALEGMTWELRDREQAVLAVLKQIRHSLSGVEDVMPVAAGFGRRLDTVIIELEDLADEGGRKAADVEYDAGRIESIHRRLDVLYGLLYKYKVETVEELLEIRDDLDRRLQEVELGGEETGKLEKELERLEEGMRVLAERIHDSREGARESLCRRMEGLLSGLGIRHPEFVVRITRTERFTPQACDEVHFLFAANRNQEPGDIARVASGGEISRVMLALKYVLSSSRRMPVIIFDEIDTGLSGEVAHRMAGMMQEMASGMQVISISHLPQIAAAGDSHFKVYKEDSGEMTVSRIRRLDRGERIREIAGMMSGDSITPAALEAAEGLMSQSGGGDAR